MKPAGSERNMAATIDALRRAGAFRAIGAVPCVPSNQESPSRGSLGLPVVALIRAIKPNGPHAVAEPKFLLPVVVLPEPLLGEDVMAKLINELLLLTCMGAFIASATYAVTLLH
jgi:hypothetical protein